MIAHIKIAPLSRPGAGKESQKRSQVFKRSLPLVVEIANPKALGELPRVLDSGVHGALFFHQPLDPSKATTGRPAALAAGVADAAGVPAKSCAKRKCRGAS